MLQLCAVPFGKLHKDLEDVRNRVSTLGGRDKTLDYPAHISLSKKFDLQDASEQDLQTLLTKYFRGCTRPRTLEISHYEVTGVVFLKLESKQHKASSLSFFQECRLGYSAMPESPYFLEICSNNPNSAQIFEDAKRLIDLEYPDRTGWNVCLYKDVVNKKNGRSEWELICGA